MTHFTSSELWIIRWGMAGTAFLLTYLLIYGFEKISEVVKNMRNHNKRVCAEVNSAHTRMNH